MKWMLIALLFCSVSVCAQGNFTAAAEYHNTTDIGPGIGGHVMLTRSFAGKFNVGAGTSAIKFDSLGSLYFPVSAHFSFFPLGARRLAPFILAEPGFGIHSHTENINSTNRYSTKGGFNFFAGVGAQLRVPSLTPTLSLGLSSFTVKMEHSNTSTGETVAWSKKTTRGSGFATWPQVLSTAIY